jgi:O-succinylbenzoic acid--CoA ligase
VQGRPLLPLPAPVGEADLDAVLDRVAAALDGSGPALVPLPRDRDGDVVLAMARPGDPLEPGPDGEDVAFVVPTSGTTGLVKGALLPGSALLHSATATLERLGGAGQWLLALPTTSVAGLAVLVRSIVGGTRPERLEIGPGFSVGTFVEATSRLTGSRRYTALVPTQIWRLVAGPPEGLAALATYDAVLVGGAPLDDGLAAAATAAGARIVKTYGATETCGGCVYDGAPLDGVQVRAPKDGPIELGGPVVFTGYRLRPDLTSDALRHDGTRRWHVTNDTGIVGSDGLLRVAGRLDDIMITGGVKVAAWSVARALRDHPGVRTVITLGVPDDEWGERVVAFVVPTDPAAPPTLTDLRAHGRQSLQTAALPRQVVILSAIPHLRSGKPDRSSLLKLAAAAGG